MIWRALSYLLLNERRFQYPGPSRLAFQLITAYLTLLIYWLTSKSLEGFTEFSTRWGSASYFEFLLIGELVLILPVSIVGSWPRALRQLASEGMIDDFRLHPRGLWLPLSVLAASLQFRELIQMAATIALAYAFFGFNLAPGQLFTILGLIVFFIPAFLGLALLASSLLLNNGRGEGAIGQGLNLAAIFAGAYFPLSALDPKITQILRLISPFTVLLESAREVVASKTLHYSSLIAAITLWDSLALIVGFFAFQWVTQRMAQREFPVLSPQ